MDALTYAYVGSYDSDAAATIADSNSDEFHERSHGNGNGNGGGGTSRLHGRRKSRLGLGGGAGADGDVNRNILRVLFITIFVLFVCCMSYAFVKYVRVGSCNNPDYFVCKRDVWTTRPYMVDMLGPNPQPMPDCHVAIDGNVVTLAKMVDIQADSGRDPEKYKCMGAVSVDGGTGEVTGLCFIRKQTDGYMDADIFANDELVQCFDNPVVHPLRGDNDKPIDTVMESVWCPGKLRRGTYMSRIFKEVYVLADANDGDDGFIFSDDDAMCIQKYYNVRDILEGCY